MHSLIFLLVFYTLLYAISSFGIAHDLFSLRRTRKLFNSNPFNTPEDRYNDVPLKRRKLKKVFFDPSAKIVKDINGVKREIKKLEKKIADFEADSIPKDNFSNQIYLTLRKELMELRKKKNILLTTPQPQGKWSML